MIGTWTVVFEDQAIIKQNGDGAGGYTIDDDAFWSNSSFSNIWAIQYQAPNSNDEVEHRDGSQHCSLSAEGISFQQFIDKWDAAHLARLQEDWDNDNPIDGETAEQKIARKGERPTSYSS
jgi:hypothetical protein